MIPVISINKYCLEERIRHHNVMITNLSILISTNNWTSHDINVSLR